MAIFELADIMSRTMVDRRQDRRLSRLERKLDKVESALDTGSPVEALRLIEEIELEYETWPDLLYLKGVAYLDVRRIDDAVGCLDQVLSFEPDHVDAGLTLVGALIWDLDSPEEAVAICSRFLQEALGTSDRLDFLNLLGAACLRAGMLQNAADALEEAAEIDQRSFDGLSYCRVLMELGSFEQALEELERLLLYRGESAEARFYLGITLDRLGEEEAALHNFEEAARIEPAEFAVPSSIPVEEFAAMVEEVVAGLPPSVIEVMSQAVVSVDPWPSPGDLIEDGEQPLSALLLGLFQGHSIRERSINSPWTSLPVHITLYKRNLEYFCPTREDLVEQTRITLLHEVGHFLGLDEDDLAYRDLQ